MKKIYLFLFFLSLIGINSQAQFAELSFISDTLIVDVVAGDSVSADIVLRNIGNRDLNWMLTSGMEEKPEVDFSKTDYANWHDTVNQDWFSPRVRITRQDDRGIYNIFSEESHVRYFSPEGTEWAWGKTQDALPGDYNDWLSLTGGSPPDMVGDTVSVHLLFEDLYFDLVTKSWTSGSNGGGFSWTRWAIYDWLVIKADSGIVIPGSTDTTSIGIDARKLVEGSYLAWVVFTSNDFYNPIVYYPIKINVTGIPVIAPDYTQLELDTTFVGDSTFYELEIYNDGQGTLNIEATSQAGHIQFLEPSLVAEPLGVTTLYYAFIPTVAGNLVDTIELTSNDPVNSLVKIAFSGVAQDPPEAEIVATSSLNVTIDVNDSTLQYIVLKNNGSADLKYQIMAIGDTVFFEKPDYADYWEMPYQDIIQHDIRITRANSQSIFNIARESGFQGWGSPSPEGTLWAAGHPLDPQTTWEVYTDMGQTVTAISPYNDYSLYMPIFTTQWFKEEFGTMAMYLPDYDEYYSVDMHTWTEGANGGGFSWSRIAYNPSWIDFMKPTGSISSGVTDTLFFYFNATEKSSGEYPVQLVIETNEPENNVHQFDAVMNVISYPIIHIEDTLIDFGEVVVNQSDSLEIIVSNHGWDSLYASSITFNRPEFSTPITEGTLQPGESGELTITFSPTAEGDYSDTVYLNTNDPATPVYKVPIKATCIAAPEITVTPSLIYKALAPNTSDNGAIYISNSGLGNLYWTLSAERKLESLLEALNANYSNIVSQIPSMYDFSADISDRFIPDGGADMYDDGNYIYTSQNNSDLLYSDNMIVNGSMHFGPNSRYFTRHLPGLFVLSAEINGISSFTIHGNLGADGNGDVDETELMVLKNGIVYQGFVKRVYNAGDPSVNHLIIIEKSPSANHYINYDTDDDFHEIYGLTGTKNIHYLLYSSASGGYIDDLETQNIMEAYLDIFAEFPDWLTVDTTQGITATSMMDTVVVTLDATGLAEGDHLSTMAYVNNNQPDTGAIPVNIQLHVPGTPELDVTDTILNFGAAYVTGIDTLLIPVRNIGTDSLYLVSSSNDSSQFWTTPLPLSIPRNDSVYLPVYFSPTTDITCIDTMLIYTNDGDEPFFRLYLSGSGVYGAEIEITPMAIKDTLNNGESDVHMILIENNGVEVLNWMLAFNSLPVTFNKADYAIWTMPENQDSITANTILARANSEGLFNFAMEPGFDRDSRQSPLNTQWALGTTATVQYEDYTTWNNAFWPPDESPGKTYSLHILDENRYFDVAMTSWTAGASGGGFGYDRSEVIPWLSVDNNGDTLSPGYTDTIYVTLDATDIAAGDYLRDLLILSNDPDEMKSAVNIDLKVEADPQINSNTFLYFDDTYVSDTTFESLWIYNNGWDTLIVSDITHDLSVYGISETAFNIPPQGFRYIDIWFIPSALGEFSDTLKIFNNTPGDEIREVILMGAGFTPPQFNLLTQSISDNLVEGDSAMHIIEVNNSGGYELEWTAYAISTDTSFVSKPDWGDWTMPEYQDSISPTLIITRADNQGLFNIANESSYCCNGPTNTEWAFGPTIDAFPWSYYDWRDVAYPPPSQVGNTYSLHVLDDNRYYDITFHSWTEDGMGGGFSYSRVEVYPQWLQFPVESGIVDATDTDTIDVKLLSEGLMTGNYTGNIIIRTNDDITPEDHVSVTLNVTATAEIEVNPLALDFDTIYVNGDSTQMIYIKNVGVDPLSVTEIQAPPGFEVYPEMFTLNSGDSIFVDVTFAPGFDDVYSGNLSIISNDPDDSPEFVGLTGTAILPPDIHLQPEVLSANLFANDATSKELVISNIGSDTLFWYITGTNSGTLEPWLSLSKDMGYVKSDTTDTITVNFNSTGLTESYYSTTIEVHSNDVVDPIVEVPVVLEIGTLKVVNPLADVRVNEGFGTDTINIANVFEHASGDTIIYMVTSLNEEVVTLSIYQDSLLIVHEQGPGNSIITVRATDTTDGVAYDDFDYIINASPVVDQPLSDIILPVGFDTEVIDIRDVFYDANGDPLTYTAASNDESIVLAAISTFNLVLSEVGSGSTTIEVTADDGMGTPAKDTVTVIVNSTPVISAPIANQLVNNGFSTLKIDLNSVFSDPDSDALTFSYTNSETSVATLALDGDTLVITEAGLGTTWITVTADDGLQGIVTDTFSFTINGIPVVENPIGDTSLAIGFTTYKISISNVFSDPDSDVLNLNVTSSATDVVSAAIIGDTLVITEVGNGTSNITLTANDGNGGSTDDIFTVTVNTAPVVSTPIADVSVNEGFGTHVVTLSGVFTDADGDNLTYTAVSSNTSVVTVAVSGSSLTATEAGLGTSTITVTADDGNGGTVDDVFDFVVNDLINVNITEIERLKIYPNPTTGKIWLEPEGEINNSITIEVVNTIGQKVYKNSYDVMGTKEMIDLGSYKSGLYYLKLFVEDELKRVETIVLE